MHSRRSNLPNRPFDDTGVYWLVWCWQFHAHGYESRVIRLDGDPAMSMILRLLVLLLFLFSSSIPQTTMRGLSSMRGRADMGRVVYELVSFTTPPPYYGGLEVFRSFDLTNWTTTANSYECSNAVRDPSITKYNGNYYLIHTNPCGATSTHAVAWSKSSDGLSWSAGATLDMTTLGDPGNTFAWAPEWFIDPNSTGLSAVHVLIALDSQLYEFHPTAEDFSTWSNVIHVTVTGVSSLIDPFWVYRSGTYYIWYKLQDGSCNIQYASSSTLLGTYTNVKTGNWAGFVNSGCVEGPSLIKNLAGGWRLFLDLDHNDLAAGQINYSDSADDWTTWTPISPIFTPTQAKHGTAIRLP